MQYVLIVETLYCAFYNHKGRASAVGLKAWRSVIPGASSQGSLSFFFLQYVKIASLSLYTYRYMHEVHIKNVGKYFLKLSDLKVIKVKHSGVKRLLPTQHPNQICSGTK